MHTDTLYGHIKTNKKRTTFLAFCRYLRSLYPPSVRIAIVLDNFSPHLSTKGRQPGRALGRGQIQQRRVGVRAHQHVVPQSHQCHFTALSYFALAAPIIAFINNRTPHIRRYIAWRNRNKTHPELGAGASPRFVEASPKGVAMPETRRRFDPDFKEERSGSSERQVSRSPRWPGIWGSTMAPWVTGWPRTAPERGESEGLSSDERARLRELEREVAELRMERDVLKRSVVLWVKEATR